MEITGESSGAVRSSEDVPTLPSKEAVSAPVGAIRNSAVCVFTAISAAVTFTTTTDLAATVCEDFCVSSPLHPAIDAETTKHTASSAAIHTAEPIPTRLLLWRRSALPALLISIQPSILRENLFSILVIHLLQNTVRKLHPVYLPSSLARIFPIRKIFVSGFQPSEVVRVHRFLRFGIRSEHDSVLKVDKKLSRPPRLPA